MYKYGLLLLVMVTGSATSFSMVDAALKQRVMPLEFFLVAPLIKQIIPGFNAIDTQPGNNLRALHIVTDGPLLLTGEKPETQWQTGCYLVDRDWQCSGITDTIVSVWLDPESKSSWELSERSGSAVVMECQALPPELESTFLINRQSAKDMSDGEVHQQAVIAKANRLKNMIWRLLKKVLEDHNDLRLFLQKHTGISEHDQAEIWQEVEKVREGYYQTLPQGQQSRGYSDNPIPLPTTRWCLAQTRDACKAVLDRVLAAANEEPGKSDKNKKGDKTSREEKLGKNNPHSPAKAKGEHECEYCGNKYKQKGHLNRHLITHKTGEKSYQCEHCGRNFTRRDSLTRHLLSQTCEKPYQCEHCGKRFKKKSDLTRHQRIHTGETPYKCEHCEQKFTDSSGLKSHRRVHHTGKLVSSPVTEQPPLLPNREVNAKGSSFTSNGKESLSRDDKLQPKDERPEIESETPEGVVQQPISGNDTNSFESSAPATGDSTDTAHTNSTGLDDAPGALEVFMERELDADFVCWDDQPDEIKKIPTFDAP